MTNTENIAFTFPQEQDTNAKTKSQVYETIGNANYQELTINEKFGIIFSEHADSTKTISKKPVIDKKFYVIFFEDENVVNSSLFKITTIIKSKTNRNK